jgi:hypothetical protein
MACVRAQGLPVVVAGSAPVHGVAFSIYEFCKRLLGADQCVPPTHHARSMVRAGVLTTLVRVLRVCRVRRVLCCVEQ